VDTSLSRLQVASHFWTRRSTGALVVTGGLSGLIVTVSDFNAIASPLAYLIGGLFAFLYSLGLLAGIRLLEGDPTAARKVKVYLSFQIPVIQSDLLSYSFASIGLVDVVFRGAGILDLNYSVGSGWAFSLFTDEDLSGIGINLVPCVILVMLSFVPSDSGVPSQSNVSGRIDD
jgi:hypothetical protein